MANKVITQTFLSDKTKLLRT